MHDISECAGCRLCRSMAGLKPKSPVPCSFFLDNCCRYTKRECGFSHLRFDEIPPCRSRNCRFGPEKCLFWHDPVPKVDVEVGIEENPHCLDGECPTPPIVQPTPAPAKKKTKRRRKKKNKKNRLVESFNRDSQSTSQNPFQPLSDEDSESESDPDSVQETNHQSIPSSIVVDGPIDESKENPSVIDEAREVKEIEVSPSEMSEEQRLDNCDKDTPVNNATEVDNSIPSLPALPTVEESPPQQFGIIEKESNGLIFPYCASCSERIMSFECTDDPSGFGQCHDCSRTQLPYYFQHLRNQDSTVTFNHVINQSIKFPCK